MLAELAEKIISDQRWQADRNFCDQLQLVRDSGMSLRPSLLRAQSETSCQVDWQTLDKRLAPGHLDWLRRLRSERPDIAAEFNSVLAKAEQVWQQCLAA